jgi:alpha-amylase/alpha-mannosidase (GH57 family)
MATINLCFLWHMHQPLYKDLVSGKYRLPWARLHALKDYYGMVSMLRNFPKVHQTFNLVPSLLIQIEEYAEGRASDPFLQAALKPAESLDKAEKEFILRYFFQANEHRLIQRYPRYAELFRIVQHSNNVPELAAAAFDTQAFRDLQVLSQLAWFDEEYLRNDRQVRDLAQKGRDYLLDDQALLGQKQLEAMGNVIGAYREFAASGQIELSTSAFYHPILPLVCDTNVASVSHPYIPLPMQFSYPGDAEEQLRRSLDYFETRFGGRPEGFWPSEGSVSDQTFEIAAHLGFRWSASDDGVLARTLGKKATPAVTYQPYIWRQGGRELSVIFRDHRLSDLIGFVYQRMDAVEAANHFLAEVRKNCAPVLKAGHDAVVGIILDGENAWEWYFENGRPFLSELYTRISESNDIAALTISEGLRKRKAKELKRIFPGSWIDANFDIWIGAEEDNRAWDQLSRARKLYDEVKQSPQANDISKEQLELAFEELLIAEGSDWCWWYGPEHSSANRGEFDQLYREHLCNVYRLLGREIPVELGESMLRKAETAVHEHPSGLIQPIIDGQISSRQEWTDGGRYRTDQRSGAMHSQRSLFQELHYGTDGQNLFLRVDFTAQNSLTPEVELRFRLRNPAGDTFRIHLCQREPDDLQIESDLPSDSMAAAIQDICELRVSMGALRIRRGDPVFLQFSVLREGLPIAWLPASGELEVQANPMMAAYAF